MAQKSNGSRRTKPDEYEFGTLLLLKGSAGHRLLKCEAPEVLIEGAAGTGKTRCVLEKVYMLASDYPGSRYLLCRKARSTMTESVLVTWETNVLPHNHESLARRLTRGGRKIYTFANGAEVIVAGLDDPVKTFSSEYDMICVFEAIETSEDDWEFLQRALRNNVVPYQQIIADTNPGPEFHWLNQRANPDPVTGECKMVRLKAKFEDNPTLESHYLKRLSNLTGHRRKRMFEGKWVSAEGLIYENFDRSEHLIAAKLIEDHGHWSLEVPAWDQVVQLRYFIAGVDWGFRNPGAILVFGIDADRRAFLVHETYRCEKLIDWWTDRAHKLSDKFDIQRFECDPARPEYIEQFNLEMGRKGDFWIADGANNDFEVGTDMVRHRFEEKTLFIVAGCLDRVDRLRHDKRKPTCLVDELDGYTHCETKDKQRVKEEAAPDSEDHSADCLRYAMMFLDRNDWNYKDPLQHFNPGTYGHLLEHESVVYDGDEAYDDEP